MRSEQAPILSRESLIKELWVRALWFPLLVFSAHVLFDWILGITKYFPGSDIIFHVLGGLAIAFCFARAFTSLQVRGLVGEVRGALHPLFIFSLTATAAVMWEFAEFTYDWYFGTKVQVDLANTMSDMAFGILGGIAYIFGSGRSRNKN